MGNSQSSNSRDYKQQLGYFPNFDSRPIKDQDYKIVEQRHLDRVLNDEFPDLFEDEAVEHVWIYTCSLNNEEGAKIGTTVLGSVAGVAGVLSFVPGISEKKCLLKLTSPWYTIVTLDTYFLDLVAGIIVAVATGAGAAISAVTTPFLNHQFVLIKTQKWHYIVAKGKEGCEIIRAPHHLKKHLIATQQQFEEATRPLQSDPTPEVWKHDKGRSISTYDRFAFLFAYEIVYLIFRKT